VQAQCQIKQSGDSVGDLPSAIANVGNGLLMLEQLDYLKTQIRFMTPTPPRALVDPQPAQGHPVFGKYEYDRGKTDDSDTKICCINEG
jgi:hypothetical protein